MCPPKSSESRQVRIEKLANATVSSWEKLYEVFGNKLRNMVLLVLNLILIVVVVDGVLVLVEVSYEIGPKTVGWLQLTPVAFFHVYSRRICWEACVSS